jgi:hypothetical protein
VDHVAGARVGHGHQASTRLRACATASGQIPLRQIPLHAIPCPPARPQICARILELTREAQKDRASGIIEVTCMRDQWEPHVFHFYERYMDYAYLSKIAATPAMVEQMEKVGHAGIRLFQRRKRKPLPSPPLPSRRPPFKHFRPGGEG